MHMMGLFVKIDGGGVKIPGFWGVDYYVDSTIFFQGSLAGDI